MIKSDAFKQLPVTGKRRKQEAAIRKIQGEKNNTKERGRRMKGLESRACNLDVRKD